MPRRHPLPQVLSHWGARWQEAWIMFGKMDGHKVNGRHPGFFEHSPRRWQLLWMDMYSVLNEGGGLEGFSPDFANECYAMWLHGYNSHSHHFPSDLEDVSREEKQDLIRALWDQFWEEEPPEIDRWWL